MTPNHRGHVTTRIPERRITRRSSWLAINNERHATMDDTVHTVITVLGRLTHGLDLVDESDARIYSRRVCGVLSPLTDAVVGRILDELGGDSVRCRTMGQRITAVQGIVTSAAFWHRLG